MFLVAASLALILSASCPQEDDPSPESVAAAREAFAVAGVAEREARFLELEELVDDLELQAVLLERLDRRIEEASKHATMRNLERVYREKAALDALRTRVLELIRDESQYIYPYKGPGVTPEAAAGYREAQKTIDGLVTEVEKIWRSKKRVKLSSSFKGIVEDLQWIVHARPKLLKLKKLPHGIPNWVVAIPVGDSTRLLNVRTFPVTVAEAQRIQRDALILRHNKERMAWARKARAGVTEAQRPSEVETEQVALTNEYRRLLGLRALAWNPSLQAATRHHSEYQSRWGILSHYEEKDPGNYDFRMRCRRLGYRRPRGENCSMGSPGPEATHVAWRHSSGHHRSLVSPGHTEMASSLAGDYWTQNFGGGDVDDVRLGEWQTVRRK